MKIYNMHEAKTNLSHLVQLVEAGEEVIIAKAGKPMVRLLKYPEMSLKRRLPGALKGKIIMSDDFDDESEEINEMFYGKPLA